MLKWLFSSRYRRLCRVQAARRRLNAERAEREYEAAKERLWAAYINAPTYRESRQLMALIWKTTAREAACG